MDNINFVAENSDYIKVNQNKILEIIDIIKNTIYLILMPERCTSLKKLVIEEELNNFKEMKGN